MEGHGAQGQSCPPFAASSPTTFVYVSPGQLAGPYASLVCSRLQTLASTVPWSRQVFFINRQAHLLRKRSDTDLEVPGLPLSSETLTVGGSFSLQHSAQVGIFLPVTFSLLPAPCQAPDQGARGLESSPSAISIFPLYHPCPGFSLCLDVPMMGEAEPSHPNSPDCWVVSLALATLWHLLGTPWEF